MKTKDALIDMLAVATLFLFGIMSCAHFLGGRRPSVETYTLRVPPTETKNPYYVSNRPPLQPNPLIPLPVGSIRARGWLLTQLQLMRDGMTGHLPELSEWCKKEGSAWMSPEGEGERGWEELPYWLRGFGDTGYLLDDKEIIQEARDWIEAVLASQEPGGYFGPRANKKNHDHWPNMIMLNVLQSYYEYTGDDRVIPFMTRYFNWQFNSPWLHLLPESWQKIRGGDNLQSVYWLYNRTGEPWLLDLATAIHERTADWTSGIASWHGVNICQSFREPAQYYQQSGDPQHLEATERNYQTVMDIYGQVPGGMFGADENCREGYTDPRQAAETCSMVEFMLSNEILLSITGHTVYADRCEEIAFNSLPAALTPDLKALHYLTAPNMVQLDRENKSPGLQNHGCMLAYSPWKYRCCQHNVSHGWPYFTEHLWMATQNNGLAAVMYAPCEVTAIVGNRAYARIVETTTYPFGEEVQLKLHISKPMLFPLMLRIPAWCENAGVSINGRKIRVKPSPSTYLVIEKIWQQGDVVILTMPMQIRVRTWEKNKNSVSVNRGPLTYSLKIGARWERFGDSQAWPEWEVYPTTPWNYALVLAAGDPSSSFEVVKIATELPDQPFDSANAPIEIRAQGRRIPDWKMENGLVGLLPESPVSTKEPVEKITLIPMGCARLRISAFPVAAGDS